MSDFSDLLQEAEKLTMDLEETSELPKVQRSLKQVLDASNDLYSHVAQGGSQDVQANLLLGSKGINLPKIAQKLESISVKKTLEPLEPEDDLDISAYLKNEMRNQILGCIDNACMEEAGEAFDNAFIHQTSEWKQQKRQIFNAISGRRGMPIGPAQRSRILLDKSYNILSHLGVNETLYGAKLAEYNSDIVKGRPKPNLVNAFNNLTNEFKDAKVKDMWEIIKYMIQLSPFPQSGDPIECRYTKAIILDLVAQGKKYLEDRYKIYMTRVISENLAQAGRGGIPGTYPLIKSYVGLRFQGEYIGLKDGLVDDRPIWPMVYYCLRCGDIASALECLKRSGLNEYHEIVNILNMKLKNPTSPEIVKLEDSIRFTYRRFVRNESDPFKRIIWSILGCCDVSDEHSEVARTADDYLWLKLNLVCIDNQKDGCIKYDDLQNLILNTYGESYYDAFNQPHLYFQMLALTGQFEAAIEFLFRVETYKVHAVHMAIALNELYLLGGPHDCHTPLLFTDSGDPKPAKRLNLPRLIMIYVKCFELNNPKEAMDYYYQLRNMKTVDKENLFDVCVAELAVETKEYEKILGRVQKNGIRSKGLIDHFVNSNITVNHIAELIGNMLKRKGLYEESLDIFDIANNQEEILTWLCNLLSQFAQDKNEPASMRERLQRRAFAFAERLTSDGCDCSAQLANSFLKLKDLTIFFDLYNEGDYVKALKFLNEIQIIPLKQEDIPDRVKLFSMLISDIFKVIPDLLLATMHALFNQYQNIRAGYDNLPKYQDSTLEMLDVLRKQAKTVTDYAGMLPIRMPSDINARLVQMEILMH